MLPYFPNFKCLSSADRQDIEQFTGGFLPYSDFNFNSMYAWDVENKMRIAQLNGNLVVLFSDYLNSKPFLSFMGCNKVSETALALVAYSENHFDDSELKLIPETVADCLCPQTFVIAPDRDAYDYIYSTSELANIHLSLKRHDAGRLVNKFVNRFPNYQCFCAPISAIEAPLLRELYRRWALNKDVDYLTSNEYLAFEKLLQSISAKIHALLLYVENDLKGFSFFEVLSTEFAIAHFSKADTAYKGIYEFIHWHTGKVLLGMGIQYYNYEQDLGIENLRKSKEKYKLHTFLKKYTVKKTQAYSLPP